MRWKSEKQKDSLPPEIPDKKVFSVTGKKSKKNSVARVVPSDEEELAKFRKLWRVPDAEPGQFLVTRAQPASGNVPHVISEDELLKKYRLPDLP